MLQLRLAWALKFPYRENKGAREREKWEDDTLPTPHTHKLSLGFPIQKLRSTYIGPTVQIYPVRFVPTLLDVTGHPTVLKILSGKYRLSWYETRKGRVERNNEKNKIHFSSVSILFLEEQSTTFLLYFLNRYQETF